MAKDKLVMGFVLLVLCFGAVSSAFAQSPDELSEDERVTLGKLFSAARRAYESHDFETSIAKLRAAYEVFPEPSILYRIAEMQEELGQPQAIDTYEAYLTASPDASNLQMVLGRIKRLRDAQPQAPTTARVTLETEPEGAKIYIDDMEERRGVTPFELELESGTYTIKLVKAGYETSQRTIKVTAGELRTFDFTLREKPKLVVVPPDPVDPGPAMATWVFASLGGASAIAAGTFFVLAQSRQGQLEEWNQDKDLIERPPDYQDTLNQEKTYRTLTWVAAGSSVAFLATSAVLYFVTSNPNVDEATTSLTFGDRYFGVMTRW